MVHGLACVIELWMHAGRWMLCVRHMSYGGCLWHLLICRRNDHVIRPPDASKAVYLPVLPFPFLPFPSLSFPLLPFPSFPSLPFPSTPTFVVRFAQTHKPREYSSQTASHRKPRVPSRRLRGPRVNPRNTSVNWTVNLSTAAAALTVNIPLPNCPMGNIHSR